MLVDVLLKKHGFRILIKEGDTPWALGTRPGLWEHALGFGNTPWALGTRPGLWEHDGDASVTL